MLIKQLLKWNVCSTVVWIALLQIFAEALGYSENTSLGRRGVTGVLQSPRRSGHCSSSVIESCHGQMDHPFTPGPSVLWWDELSKWLHYIIWIHHLKNPAGLLLGSHGGIWMQRQQSSQQASSQLSHVVPPQCWQQKRAAANREEIMFVSVFKREIECIVC